MFKSLLSDNAFVSSTISNRSSLDPKTISVYPISEYNLEGIKILYDNSIRMGSENINVHVASVSPTLWMGDVLDKHWTKISYVCTGPNFNIMRVENDNIVEKSYSVKSDTILTDKDLDDFFEKGTWKRFVLFSIGKYADLNTMKTYYSVRYADITEKFEERDLKISNILDNKV